MLYLLAASQTFFAPVTFTSSYLVIGRTLSLCSAASNLKHFLENVQEIDSALYQKVESIFGKNQYFDKLGGILDI